MSQRRTVLSRLGLTVMCSLAFLGSPALQGEDLLLDGSFEAGTSDPPNNPFWNEASTNFGSVICRRDDPNLNCDPASGDLTIDSLSGEWFAWFGGFVADGGTTSPEVSSLDQTVSIPADGGSGQASATLVYHVMVRRCSTDPGDATDAFEIRLDGALADKIDVNDPDCGTTVYRRERVDLTTELGQTVQLQLEGLFNGNASLPTSILIDDVALYACQYPADVVISNEVLTGTQERRGCLTLTAGDNTTIATGADVLFEAPLRVTLASGFSVESGATLTVRSGA